jgi:cytochrome c553
MIRRKEMKINLMSVAVASVVSVSAMLPIRLMADPGEDYSLARGGRLYDAWFKESSDTKAPNIPNPAYPRNSNYYGKKSSDWRCKECHGWDYRGAEGAYRSGKHHTGIKGIRGKEGATMEEIIAILKDENHGYGNTTMKESDYLDLAMFVSKGQVDMEIFIDPKTKAAKGDTKKGKSYYQTLCVNCHGLDGKLDDQMPPVGKLASGNPWEVAHKLLNGQPHSEMPALRALELQVTSDILTYSQTLPSE